MLSVTMDSDGGSKLNGIRQIVKLKEMLQKWQSVTLGTKPSNSLSDHVTNDDGSISPLINKSVLNVMNCESDNEDSCQSPAEPLPPPDVPKGYLAVYVGPELRRFIIPTSYLSHPLFKVLLEKAADEFGFDQSGGLTIPCEIETFKYLLKCMENEQKEQLGDSARKLFALIYMWFSSNLIKWFFCLLIMLFHCEMVDASNSDSGPSLNFPLLLINRNQRLPHVHFHTRKIN
ncbi:Indole-3-acetic acid-induced protein ARG7 [Glycine max]|nr:Indole-3-acetic acid-induced protein ARG7 [Glycine max]